MEDQGIEWGRLLQGLKRHKWLVLAAALVGIAAGTVLYQTAQPLYQTRATIWLGPADQESGPIRPAEIFEGQGWAELLSSQAVLLPVVQSERLFVSGVSGADTARLAGLTVTDSLEPGRYRLTHLSKGRFELRRRTGGFGLSSFLGRGGGILEPSDSVVQRGEIGQASVGEPVGFRWSLSQTGASPGTETVFRVERPTDAVERIRSGLMVGYSADAGNLINTQFTWSTSQGAMRLHNAILESFLQVAQRLKSQKQKEVVTILERQTDYAAARLDSAELALRNFRVETITLPGEPTTTSVPGTEGGESAGGSAGTRDPVFGAFFEQRLTRDQLDSQVEDLRQVLQDVDSSDELDVLALRLNPAVERSPQLQQALDDLTQMQAERRSLLNQYTQEYPPVQQLNAQIESQKQDVIPGLVRNLIDQLERRVKQLDQRITSRAQELREIPKRSIQEERLRREVQMAEQLHSNLLTRLKEAQLSARTNLPDLQVVDRATPPGGPSQNPGPRLFMIASMAGLGLGVGGSLLLDRFDSKIRYPDDVTDNVGIGILGIVPRLPAGSGLADQEQEQEALESFRAIRGQLTRRGGTRPLVTLVTSPSPREGKTLISSNLAISFAGTGVRTLVMDCDTRRGDLHQFFERPSRPGVAEVLRGDAGVDDVLTATEVPGLHLIPRGDIRGFNTELLDSERMNALLRRLREEYDYIVLDAPPLQAGADSLFLGERADQVLLVLRTGKTDREEARSRLEGIGSFSLPLVGAVMNDVPAADGAYGYYYYSSYGPNQIEGEVVTA